MAVFLFKNILLAKPRLLQFLLNSFANLCFYIVHISGVDNDFSSMVRSSEKPWSFSLSPAKSMSSEDSQSMEGAHILATISEPSNASQSNDSLWLLRSPNTSGTDNEDEASREEEVANILMTLHEDLTSSSINEGHLVFSPPCSIDEEEASRQEVANILLALGSREHFP